jgi:hypothetical protein
MRPARGLVRLVSPLAIALGAIVVSVAVPGQRAARASAPATQASPGPAGGTTAPAGSDEGGAKKKARKPGAKSNSKKTSPKAKSSPATKVTRSKAPAHLAPQKLAHAQSGKSGTKSGTRSGTKSGTINEDVTLTPFPSHAGAAKKALAQNRRDQLDDAEKAARAPEQAERWQTVLFHLRNLDARADSEGCFWRLVSYYRLGQIERARSLRPACELAPKDTAIIEAEDEQAAHLQTAGTLADKEPTPVGNLAPYAGDGPAKTDR